LVAGGSKLKSVFMLRHMDSTFLPMSK